MDGVDFYDRVLEVAYPGKRVIFLEDYNRCPGLYSSEDIQVWFLVRVLSDGRLDLVSDVLYFKSPTDFEKLGTILEVWLKDSDELSNGFVLTDDEFQRNRDKYEIVETYHQIVLKNDGPNKIETVPNSLILGMRDRQFHIVSTSHVVRYKEYKGETPDV